MSEKCTYCNDERGFTEQKTILTDGRILCPPCKWDWSHGNG